MLACQTLFSLFYWGLFLNIFGACSLSRSSQVIMNFNEVITTFMYFIRVLPGRDCASFMTVLSVGYGSCCQIICNILKHAC